MSSDRKRFEGRTAFVTGAASGIGRATAMRLASEGASVACADLAAEGIASVRAEIEGLGGRAFDVVCDVASSTSVATAVAAAEAALGSIDVLANVAGTGDLPSPDGIGGLEDAEWNRVLAVNLAGPFFACRAVVPGMAARGRGAVVNVSSLAGRSKSANAGPAYSASKAGLLGLTRHLAFDYGPRGVRVNAICPGGVDTPMIRAAATAMRARSEDDAAAVARRVAAYEWFMPIKRLSTAEEQAAAIAFLASDDASYVNGVSLDVNGGLFMA